MLTEFTTDQKDFLDKSQGTIRFLVEKIPVRYSDMAGRGIMTGPEVEVFVKYTAVSDEHIQPSRLMAMRLRVGTLNRYDEEYESTLKAIRKEAVGKIDLSDPIHEVRKILEGGFE